jgi:hypothetical protein
MMRALANHRTRRPVSRRDHACAQAGLLLVSLCLSFGCSNDEIPCPENTLVIVVNMDESVQGDELIVDVAEGEAFLRHGRVTRPSGGSRGRIEVYLGADYVPEKTMRVHISPSTRGATQGRTDASVTLGSVCTQVTMTVTNDPPEPDWLCVGSVPEGNSRGDLVSNSSFYFVDMFYNAIPPATATACMDLDSGCDKPEWQGVSKDGVITPIVRAGFDGFISVDIPGQGYYPAMVDMMRAISMMNARPVIVMLKTETIQRLADQAGDPILLNERGHLTLATFDCRGYRIGGVSLSFSLQAPVDGVQPQTYILASNWHPDKTLNATDSTGTAFIANLPPGIVGVTATHQASGRLIAKFNTRVEAGKMTYVAVEPK